MKIIFEGREWDLDLEAITLKQGVAIHLAYGFTVNGWLEAVGESDPRALQCLYWLMLQQAGQPKPIRDCDCALVALAAAFADSEEEGDDETAAEPDPTPPSPPSPPGGPPSPGPSAPTATTRTRAARKAAASAATASTPGI